MSRQSVSRMSEKGLPARSMPKASLLAPAALTGPAQRPYGVSGTASGSPVRSRWAALVFSAGPGADRRSRTMTREDKAPESRLCWTG
ncbi:hypothetical protein SBADM41S_11307 [Streptomyces badius]